jgi:hypothetical protein
VSTALDRIAPTVAEDAPKHSASRPRADFVAHLIATSTKAPQTRERRRAEPGHAIAAYGALGQWPIAVGLALSRSL